MFVSCSWPVLVCYAAIFDGGRIQGGTKDELLYKNSNLRLIKILELKIDIRTYWQAFFGAKSRARDEENFEFRHQKS